MNKTATNSTAGRLRRIATILMLGTTAGIAGGASAAWDFLPTFQVAAETNDNVRLSEAEDSGIISTGTFQLGGRWAEPRSKMDFVVGATYVDYQNVNVLDDSSSEFVRFSGRRDLERGAIGMNLTGQADNLIRYYSQLDDGLDPGGDSELFLGTPGSVQQDPGGEIDINESVVSAQIDRTRIKVKPYLEFRLNRRSKVRLFYSFSSQDYDSDGERLGLRDSTRHLAGAEYIYDFSRRNSAGLEVTASALNADNRRDTDTIEARLAWAHRRSENLIFNFYVGAREVDDGVDEETGTLFRVSVDQRLNTGRFTASAERSLYPSSSGNITEGDSVTIGYQTNFSQKVSGAIRVQAISIEADNANNNADDRDYVSVTPSLSWRLSKNWTLNTQYSYRWIERERDIANGLGESESHSVSLGIAYRPRRRI